MSTVKSRRNDAQWDYVGEGFMKEIDFGLVSLRLNGAAEGERDDLGPEYKENAKTFLQNTLVRFMTLLVFISRLKCVAERTACIYAD